jgi:hypothetical protein
MSEKPGSLVPAGADRTAGEREFESYLAAHGYPEPVFEPDLSTDKKPDYLVSRAGAECICEVKEFDAERPGWMQQGGGTTSMTNVLKPIRAKIRAAAKQLKPLEEEGRPLVVVLTNPYGSWVQLRPQELVWGMYGDPIYEFAVDRQSGSQVGEGTLGVGRHGKLRADHPYISAVVVIGERENAVDFYDRLSEKNRDLPREEALREIFAARDHGEVPKGSYYRADTYRTLSPSAIPLSEVFFNGPRVRLFEYSPANGAFEQTAGPTFR